MELVESTKIKNLDEIIKIQLIELKNQLEENELVYGIRSNSLSSLYVPKDPDFFMKERKFELRELLNLPTEKNRKILFESLKSELDSCDKFEYNDKSIPLLVNQYFLNRLGMLIIMKHSLMLRWKRYCITEKLKKEIEKEYNERIKTIDDEYNDLKSRTHRLQVVKEGYICSSDQGIHEIRTDDMIMYLKGLTVHLHSMRYISQIIRILQWISMKFRKKKKEEVQVDSHSASKSEKSLKLDLVSESSYRSDLSKVISAKPTDDEFPKRENSDQYAAYGGGFAIDEKTLNMPMHTNNMGNFEHILKSLCSIYSINMDIKNITTSADEMELFSNVNRKFKTIFSIQEQMRTFKIYDKSDGGADRWGIDSSQHALLKPATWMNHNPFKPKINLAVCKYMNHLQSQQLMDEILKSAAVFLKNSNCEDTQNNLRHNALLIQHLPVVHNTGVIANPKGFNIADIFKLIYNKSNFSVKNFSSEDGNMNENDAAHDSYKFLETLQMLGLDDCVETKDDPSSVQGAYLSYLHLRFLKTRDLQRTCLSILNYFRSIERTLVINTIGFSKEEMKSSEKETYNSIDQECLSKNLGNHQYLRDNMEDFKVLAHQFMQFESISNHDDFYFHEDGRVHIKDQMNYWIMYDVAVNDFEKLEEDLILIGSYYITIDRDYRTAGLINRKRTQTDTDKDASFISEFGHREIDRTGVLYDIWNHHTEFMQSKMKLVDMYMEVYNSIQNKEDRRLIAQTITNIIYQKPRLDITHCYFITSYRLESDLLKVETSILQTVLEREKDRQRAYMRTEYKDSNDGYELVEKLLIHPNTDESVLSPLYILEFVPSMAMIIKVKYALEYAWANYKVNLGPSSLLTEMKRELEFLQMIAVEIKQTDIFNGNAYEDGLLDSLLSTSILDNPKEISILGELFIKNIENRNTRGEKKTRKLKMMNEFGRLMELVTIRLRLINLLWECQYLAEIYKIQETSLGYGHCHMYMRLEPFESAVRKDVAEFYKPLLYISSVQDDDTMLDTYIPKKESLAIHELDIIHLGKLQLSKTSRILDLLANKGLEDLQLTLKMQYCHLSALSVGIVLCDVSRPSLYKLQDIVAISEMERTETGSTQFTVPISLQNGPTPLALDKNRANDMAHFDYYPEAFFSLQLEKIPVRDKMLNTFLKKYPNPSRINPIEMDKIKRENISYFIETFFDRITHNALKAQIIAYYNSILNVLKLLPDIALEFFQFGMDSKPDDMLLTNIGNFDIDPRVLRLRTRKVISEDGKLLNIWYIPHFTEILFLHRQLEDVKANKILGDLLRLVMSFHDIIHYVIGIGNLSFHRIRVTDKLKEEIRSKHGLPTETNCFNLVHQIHREGSDAPSVFTDYETSSHFQLKKEFIDLENQLRNLKDPTNMEEVIELLNARKNYYYFYVDTFVTTVLPEALLTSNRVDIFDQLNSGVESAMISVDKARISRYVFKDLSVPEPILLTDVNTIKYFPWRRLIDTKGPFIVNFDTWINISDHIQLCFAAINDEDRYFIKDQLCTFNLLMEEILLEHGMKMKHKDIPNTKTEFFLLSEKFQKKGKKDGILHSESGNTEEDNASQTNHLSQPISIDRTPIEAYKVLIENLLALKKLKMLKCYYYCSKLNTTKINSVEKYGTVTKLFRQEIVFPQLLKLSDELSMSYLYYFGPTFVGDIIVYPKGVSLTLVNKRLTDALIDEIQKRRITDVHWCITKQLHRVIKERNYNGNEKDFNEYNVLKKTYLKPNLSVTISRKINDSIVMEEKQRIKESSLVISQFEEEDIKEDENNVAVDKQLVKISKKKLNECLQYFGNTVQNIQKETYENYAMYFENLLKHQQRLLHEKEMIINDLHKRAQLKDQSISVEKQFLLANKTTNLVMEINYLHAKLKEKVQFETKQNVQLKRQRTLEFKFIVRNLYSLAFEQVTQMKNAINRFGCEVFQKINFIRIEAFNDLSKIKEKSGAKTTSDDDLLAQNISINNELNKNRLENAHIAIITAGMKSLYNWMYTYTMNVNNEELESYENELYEYKNVVLLTKQVAEQKLKLMKCEVKRLNETLQSTKKDLSDLLTTLDSEIHQKSNKRKKEEINAKKMKEGINNKSVQISNMLELIGETNAKMATMKSLYDANLAEKQIVVFESQENVNKLKKMLVKERELKQQAFMKVDDLVSQVYEFEAAFAVVTDVIRPRVKRESTITALSKPRNPTSKPGHPTMNFDYSLPEKTAARLTYKSVVNQHCIPYTPCHYLPFRRDRKGMHQSRTKFKRQLIEQVQETTNLISLPRLNSKNKNSK